MIGIKITAAQNMTVKVRWLEVASQAIRLLFGMVLDGSRRVDEILKRAMPWDVMVGVARRSWARNENAMRTSLAFNRHQAGMDHLTLPYLAEDDLIRHTIDKRKPDVE
jgi:urocanate hydratase